MFPDEIRVIAFRLLRDRILDMAPGTCMSKDELVKLLNRALLDASNEGVTEVSDRLQTWAP